MIDKMSEKRSQRLNKLQVKRAAGAVSAVLNWRI